jgi:ABC-2 type transport system permease protein
MSGRRILAIFRRLVQETRRDRRSVALLFIVPTIVTGLVTFVIREGQTSPSADPIASLAPVMVGFFAYLFAYILTGTSFLRERTGGTLERLMATPVVRAEVVIGYALGFGLFATIQVAFLMAWSLSSVHVPSIGPLPDFWLGLGIPIAGSPVTAFVVVLVMALGAVSLGILLSTFARNELQISQFVPLVVVPQVLLSGLVPISNLPGAVRPFVELMPLGYAVDGLRRVLADGAGLTAAAIQLDVVVLAVVAVALGVIASLTIRRDIA